MKENQEVLNIDQQNLAEAWQRTLPQLLHYGDSVEVKPIKGRSNALMIHINVKGRTGYDFDFMCTYKDPREVDVDVINVGTTGLIDDQHKNVAKELIHDYTRHIHECAQAVQSMTH
ncbi:MAG: hypothetical protein ACH0QD_06195 [Tepidibacillus sp.]